MGYDMYDIWSIWGCSLCGKSSKLGWFGVPVDIRVSRHLCYRYIRSTNDCEALRISQLFYFFLFEISPVILLNCCLSIVSGSRALERILWPFLTSILEPFQCILQGYAYRPGYFPFFYPVEMECFFSSLLSVCRPLFEITGFYQDKRAMHLLPGEP